MDSSSMPIWTAVIIAALTAVGGGGGVAAIIKARADRQAGVDSHELAEDDALQKRWQAIAEAQLELLLTPLREEVARLREEVAAVRTESAAVQTKYWKAINYIRTLSSWIARHVTDPELTPPVPPADVVGDI